MASFRRKARFPPLVGVSSVETVFESRGVLYFQTLEGPLCADGIDYITYYKGRFEANESWSVISRK